MPKFEFCLPTLGKNVPAGPDWLHEVKYDGYRMMVIREDDRVRLITRGGYNWTKSKGNRRAFRHGRYTAEAIAERRTFAALLRDMRSAVPGSLSPR
jgi:ATP-dependent DNA ligase